MVALAPVLSFEEGWGCAMRDEQVRSWLFSSSPATPVELMKMRDNGPFVVSCSITKTFKLYGSCARLHDTASVGLVLTYSARDGDVPLVAMQDSDYADNRYVVSRLAVVSCGGRVYSFEFTWLVNGVLSMRFHPYNAMTGTRLLSYIVHTFSSVDASFLRMMSTDPTSVFLSGRFENMLLIKPWYTVMFIDLAFQTPCVFCTVRGELQCGCPTPMKRRRTPGAVGMCNIRSYRERPIWGELGIIMDSITHAGTGKGLYNVLVTSEGERNVPAAGIVSFNCAVQLGIPSHDVMQQFLNYAGGSVAHPKRLQLASSSDDEFVASDGGSGSDNGSGSGNGSGSAIAYEKTTHTQAADETPQEESDIFIPTVRADYQVPDNGSTRVSNQIVTAMSNPKPSVSDASQSSSGTGATRDDGPSNESDYVADHVQRVARRAMQRAMREVENAALVAVAKSKGGSSGSGGGAKCVPVTDGGGTDPGGGIQKERVFTCPICGLQVKNKHSNLTRHINLKHENVRKFACNIPGCGRRFQSKHNLQRHQKSVHTSQTK